MYFYNNAEQEKYVAKPSTVSTSSVKLEYYQETSSLLILLFQSNS